MAVNFGQMDRNYKGLHIGRVKDMQQAAARRSLEGLQEFEDQFMVEIAGRGEEFPVWARFDLRFDVVFVDATGQRDAPFDRPHFTHGAYIERGGPVGVLACVMEWKTTRRNETIGCTLAVGAVATDVSRSFQGLLHARFQGYGAPVEQYGDPSQWDVD